MRREFNKTAEQRLFPSLFGSILLASLVTGLIIYTAAIILFVYNAVVVQRATLQYTSRWRLYNNSMVRE
jgi:hypothetical protein